MKKNTIKTQSHKDPIKCCKTLVFPSQKIQKSNVQWSAKQSQVSNLENDLEIT